MGLRVTHYYIFVIMLTKGVSSHEIRLDQSPAVVKRPGETVKISCKISGYSMTSYYMHWIRQKPGKALEWLGWMNTGNNRRTHAESVKNQLTLTEDVSASTQYLETKSLRTEDTAVYYCTRSDYGAFDYWGKGTMVTVTSAVQGPPQSLFPLWQCDPSKDGYITLGCVTRDLASADGLTFSWKDPSGNAITDVVQYPAVRANGGYTSVSHVRVKFAEWDQQKQYKCKVENSKGEKEAPLRKPDEDVTKPNITTSSRTTSNGVNLLCWLTGFHPKAIGIKWYQDTSLLKEEKPLQTFETSRGRQKEFAVLSQITVDAQTWNKGTKFNCEVRHKSGAYNQTFSKCEDKLIMLPQIRLEKPSLKSVLEEKTVAVSCFVETDLNPEVSWHVDGQKMIQQINTVIEQGTTVSNLTMNAFKWKQLLTVKCKAEHSCFPFAIEKEIVFTEPQKTPTVVIRRNLADIQKEHTIVLECAATDLPSGELLVTFQANGIKLSQDQYVDLPQGLDSLTRQVTVPIQQPTTDKRFTCQIENQSRRWKSDSTGNIFGDPSVVLSVVSGVDTKGSETQKLLCSGIGLNPKITWNPAAGNNAHIARTMEADGRVKVVSEITVPQPDWNNGNTFTCQVKDPTSNQFFKKNTSICSVTPDFAQKAQVYILAPSISDLKANNNNNNKVSVTCLLLGHRLNAFSITWKVENAISTQDVTREAPRVHINGTESLQSVLKVQTTEWNNYKTVSCEVKHFCSKDSKQYNISKIREPQKTPTVVIRRNLADIQKEHTIVLECAATDLPSGELLVTFQANGIQFSQDQYVDLPQGLDSLTRQVTVPIQQPTTDKRFTCQIESQSGRWKSDSTGNIFGDPSVELSVVSGVDTKGSETQKLLCSGIGLNPKITWNPAAGNNAHIARTMEADGRVKVVSEITVPQPDWNNGNTFTCQVKDPTSNQFFKNSTSICSVTPDFAQKAQVYILAPSISDLKANNNNNKVSVTCLLLGHRLNAFSITWKVENAISTQDVTREAPRVHINGTESLQSVLKVQTTEWNNYKTVSCEVKHFCSKDSKQYNISKIREPQKTPTVVIRRNLADIQKEHTIVLECAATDLPSGELLVTFQANGIKLSQDQYVDLPQGLDTLTRQVTVPIQQPTTDKRFTCQIESQSGRWKSDSTGNIFGDPSVELSVVSGVDTKGSETQKLLCSGIGLNPKITWNPAAGNNAHIARTMEADGRVKVVSEITVPQPDWNNGNTFTCQVKDPTSNQFFKKNTSICSVTPDFAQKAQVYILAPSISDLKANNNKVSVTCLLLGHRLNAFSITWKVENAISTQDVTREAPRVHINGTESLRSVLKVQTTEWNNYKTVSCEVKHFCSKDSKQYNISKIREPKKPTVQILSPSDDELSGKGKGALLCLIKDFQPAEISVHWELNVKRLDASHFTNSPVGMHSESGGYSMHSTLTLTSKMEDGTFSCVVIHESSDTPIKGTIKNIYASIKQQEPSVKLLNNQNELLCLVYDYSPSAINITWLQNSVNLTHGNRTSSPAKGSDGKFSIQSHLYVQASEWAPGDTYTCQVEHITGTTTHSISKTEFIEESIYFDENKSEAASLDQSEETWNMACAFIILFIISLIYGCSMTLVKVKAA
ncbi:hemicentin-1-like isoform X1 [Hemibagrus wyckioides]|uniref:hemicentin-1-like isoform X1 n=2 Tax=Hemibagrus wyckioides TaxID=337641 RepID=UPI00266CF2E3|nr:hemicentin-1-like isoform X1 [Hemibagrus wyckioides]